MKKHTISTFLILLLLTLDVQAASVNILGQTLFCPGNTREVQYQLTDNYDVTHYTIGCKSCLIKSPLDNKWYTPETFVIQISPPPNYITIRWDQGNIDDAWVEYIGWSGDYTNPHTQRKSKKLVKLVENSYPYNQPTLTSSVNSLVCGSTSPVTFTANWKNATSYNWTVSGGTISGDSTGSTITVIPSSGSTAYVYVKVRGKNSPCGVVTLYNEKFVNRNPPIVNEITGPDYVCYGAPSALNHYVNNIPGAQYNWTFNTGGNYTVPTGGLTSSATIKGEISGSFTISLSVTACGAQPIIKTKTVNSTNGSPTPPYISQYPGTHCAGSCATYYTQIPNGFVIENQFRYNYGNWNVANSYGAMYICTQSYDAGYKPVELRSKGICGTYGSISTQSINISNCGYMMATSVEDSITLAEMNSENDLAIYPNPSRTTMTISLPDDMQETQVTILSDQGEVIATFDNTKAMFTINTGKLQRGKYFLSVADKSKKLTKRFVVE